MPKISKDQLTQLTIDDISQGTSPLLEEPLRLLQTLSGSSYEEKELQMLDHLPKKLGYYYLILRLDALWANGGMQAVALDKDSESSARLLQRTVEAFEFFGDAVATELLREVVPVAMTAAREIEVLGQRDAPDEEFEPVWARLDAYDSRYDDLGEVYSAIVADIHQHPNDWQPNDAS